MEFQSMCLASSRASWFTLICKRPHHRGGRSFSGRPVTGDVATGSVVPVWTTSSEISTSSFGLFLSTYHSVSQKVLRTAVHKNKPKQIIQKSQSMKQWGWCWVMLCLVQSIYPKPQTELRGLFSWETEAQCPRCKNRRPDNQATSSWIPSFLFGRIHRETATWKWAHTGKPPIHLWIRIQQPFILLFVMFSVCY